MPAPAVRRLSELGPEERRRLLDRSLAAIFDPELWEAIRALYADVAARGDAAVCDALARFDGVELSPDELPVSEDELEAAAAGLDPALREAIDAMLASLRPLNEHVVSAASWRLEDGHGASVGERALPIASAALYVPCGKGSFPSVMAHLGVPATVAGVPKIVVLCPPFPGRREVDPAVLYAAWALGLRHVVRVNGPAGIAAAALGTERIPRVAKIVGPGSPAVTVAQLLAQEHGVATNMLQGPSESLILADASADPELAAADLLTEAEHGHDSAATLVTWSEPLAAAVAEAAARRLDRLPEPHRAHATSSLTRLGGILLVADEDEAFAFADEYAPEHLQLAVTDPEAALARTGHAAEILLGQSTPMAAANFTAGVPNTLPSGGYARVSSGITARTFLATSTVAALSPEALARASVSALRLAEHEGFPAHAAALRARGPAAPPPSRDG
jgi:histidinol dehydrogenase